MAHEERKSNGLLIASRCDTKNNRSLDVPGASGGFSTGCGAESA